MKETILFLIVIVLLSCNADKNQKNESVEVEDNLETSTTEETALEEVFDEAGFLDFFDEFMRDKNFQKDRVLYPILVKSKSINNANEWNHIPFYTQKEYIATMTSDTLSIFEKRLNFNTITMFILNFTKASAEVFSFEKANDNWFLENVSQPTLSNLFEFDFPDVDFVNFLINFSTNSNFQINSISFPLISVEPDYEEDFQTITNTIKKDEWKFRKLSEDLDQLTVLTDFQTDNKYRNITFRGNQNGIWVKYIFENINGDWKLIKIEDQSN